MRRNSFGDPQPATAEEIVQAMDELGLQADFAQAEVFDASDEEPPFQGWCAEISDCDSGEKRISTLGFPTMLDFGAVADAAGIDLIVEP